MWIETQEGELINLDTGALMAIKEAKIENHGYWLMLNHQAMGINRLCGEYAEKEQAEKVFEELKNKLRRNGEKIFRFKGDSEK